MAKKKMGKSMGKNISQAKLASITKKKDKDGQKGKMAKMLRGFGK